MLYPNIFRTFVKIKEENMEEGLILPNKILVKEDKPKEEKISKSGIILPETRKFTTSSGQIIMTGSACEVAQIGMRALYTPLSATRFLIDDEEVALLPETSILFLIPQKK